MSTYCPWNGVCVEKMTKKLSNVSQFVRLQSVNGFVLQIIV